jgi:hypothetical protein
MLTKERKIKDFLTMDTMLNDKKLTEGLKALSKELVPPPPPSRLSHARRRSEDVVKRPATGATKRRGSVSKR